MVDMSKLEFLSYFIKLILVLIFCFVAKIYYCKNSTSLWNFVLAMNAIKTHKQMGFDDSSIQIFDFILDTHCAMINNEGEM